MRYLATALALIPAIIVMILDPDMLGISIFVLFCLACYVAWRTRTTGGIILALIGVALLIAFFANLETLSKANLSESLIWAIVVVLPIVSGTLFIIEGIKKKA